MQVLRTPLLTLAFVAWGGTAAAQAGITATGQVYLPSGLPARQEIRLYVEMESARQPPFYVYTDMQGRFELRGLRGLIIYRVTIESDDQVWAATTVNFIPSGTHPRLDISLRPLRREPGPNAADSVSVSGFLQRVPPEAAKEYEAAVRFLKKNEHAKARPHLERAVEIYPQYVDAHNELAVAMMRDNKLAEAEGHLRAALLENPVAVRPLMNLGLCLSRQERFEDALPFLEKAVQLTAADPSAHLLLGVALMKTGKDKEAEVMLQKAYKLGGKRVAQAQYYLAVIYVQRNDAAQAARALETYLNDNPEAPNAAALRRNLEQIRAAVKP